jgi:hypothetical protein
MSARRARHPAARAATITVRTAGRIAGGIGGRIAGRIGGGIAGRITVRAVSVALAGCLLIAAAPVTVVALVSVLAAWLRGWQPARLYRAAAWCLPMVMVWLVGTGVARHGLLAVAQAPYLAWLAMWRRGAAGSGFAAAVLIAPAAVPAGLLAGGLAWSARIRSMSARSGGRSPASAAAFDRRQWRHQVRAAAARIAAPGAAPLLTVGGDFIAGAVIRSVGLPARPLTRLPATRLRSHQLVVGVTGTGKTTLLLRLWAGFIAAGLRAHAAGEGGPPLVVVLDCKGGADARRIADRARRVLREAGARHVAVWPDDASLDLWSLPPQQLTTTLVDLIEHGTGGAAYYADVMEAVVALAVSAPCGPPCSTSDFLTRLDPGWLALAYSSDGHDQDAVQVRAAAQQVSDIALRFRTLFRRLGPGLDGPGSFADADTWYCILEGTAEIAVAEAQARALVDLLAAYVAADPTGHSAQTERRQALLAVDEFSAVSRRLPIWQLYERARSLGLAVQVSAQSWQGLAGTEDERYRLAASAEGGIWLLRTPHPEPLVALAGQRKAVQSSRQLLGSLRWSRQGTSRETEELVVDPALIRALEVGQAAYIYRGTVTFTQVKRLVAGPAAVMASAPRKSEPARAPTAARSASLPDVGPFLDAAFGAGYPRGPQRAGSGGASGRQDDRHDEQASR